MGDLVDELVDRAQQRIGRVLNEKWRLDSLVGVGGMAAVYAATHRAGKRVAVKILHAELSAVQEIRRRFQREAYVANTVDHPDAVSVLDDDVTESGEVFLIMDLLEGETVDARLRARRTLDAREVLWIADKLLDVLAVAHDKGIIHRDVKPENLFLTRHGQLKVLDFGIARVRELGGTIATRSGFTLGTPAYMPPEQARGRWDEVDARTDLWAVGATMFTLLTGRFVHTGSTTNELLAEAMSSPAPTLASATRRAPPPVAAVVDGALAFDKSARWPDARAMQRAVREAHAGMADIESPDADLGVSSTMRERVLISVAVPTPPRWPTVGQDWLPTAPTAAALIEQARSSGELHVGGRALASAYVHRGVERSAADDHAGAIEDYTRAIELIPTHALAHYNRGVAHHTLDALASAIADYDASIELQPHFADAFFNRALIKRQLADALGAASDATRAIELYDAVGDGAGRGAAAGLLDALTGRS